MELRTRPSNDFLEQASHEELYLLAKNWQSEMEFYQGELRFFSNLIDKYFQWLVKDDSLTHLRDIANRISSANEFRQKLSEAIKKISGVIENMMSGRLGQDELALRQQIEELENKIDAFIKSFRSLKSEIFSTTERVMEEEKLKRLLSS